MNKPRLVPTADLPAYFEANGIAYRKEETLELGFGHGNPQYRFYPYPAPQDDETMAVFCEFHSGNFFEHDLNPHLGIGLRGPREDDPHRGRGIAIGILCNQLGNPDDPEHPLPLFRGCPDPPGGPAFFIEDFSVNDSGAPVEQWQLSLGRELPDLEGDGVYRLDVHVARHHVWAAVWRVDRAAGAGKTTYRFLGQARCDENAPGFSGDPRKPCREQARDRGVGNVFIGSAFADPGTGARVENIYIAHWKTQGQC